MKFIKKLNPLFLLSKVKEAKGAEVFMVYWRTVSMSSFGYWNRGRQVSRAFLLEDDA